MDGAGGTPEFQPLGNSALCLLSLGVLIFFLIFFYWAYFIPGQEWLWVQAAAVAEILRPEKGRTGSAGLLNGSLCGHRTSVTPSRALPWETSTWRQLGSELWLPRPPSSRPSAMFFALSALLKDLLYG